MFCMILMFLVLAINIILYELTPQYSSFGAQHYRVRDLCCLWQTCQCHKAGKFMLLIFFFFFEGGGEGGMGSFASPSSLQV